MLFQSWSCLLSLLSLAASQNDNITIDISNEFVEVNHDLLLYFLGNVRNHSVPSAFVNLLVDTEENHHTVRLIKDIFQTVGTFSVYNHYSFIPRHGILIIIVQEEEQVEKLFNSDIFSQNFDIAVVIVQNVDSPSFLSERRFWGNNQYFHIIVFGKDLDKAYVYFPYPIGPGNVSSYLPSESFYDLSNCSKLVFAIYKKRVINMHQHPLRISMFDRKITSASDGKGNFVGFDASIMRVLGTAMNFTVTIAGPTYATSGTCTFGPKFPNGTYCGSIGDLVYNRSDVAMNTMFLKQYTKDQLLVFTTSMIYDKLCIVVPASQLIPQWKVLFLGFSPEVWLITGVSYLIAVFIGYIIDRVSKTSQHNRFFNVVFTIYAMYVQQSLHKLPFRYSERLFFITLLVGCFVVGTTFQGSLLNLLSKPIFEKQINTLEDLDKSGLQVSTNSPNLVDTFGNSTKTLQSLSTKFQIAQLETTTSEMFDQIVTKRNVATLGRQHDLKITIGESYMGEYGSKIHIVPDCPRTYHLAYPMAKWSPYYNSVNTVLGRILQGGLTQTTHINLGYMAGNFKYRTRQDISASIQSAPEAFSLETLKIYFIILFLGFGVSFATFLGEVLVGRLIETKHNKNNKNVLKPKQALFMQREEYIRALNAYEREYMMYY